MNTQNQKNAKPPADGSSRLSKGMVRLVFWLIIPACILAYATGHYSYLIMTRPKAQRRPPPRQARLVSVRPIRQTTAAADVSVMGTVIPARQVTLRPEITGVINAVDPVVLPGGIIRKGQGLYEIDSRDYQAVVSQRESELQRAQLNYKLEAGSQAIAQTEYSMLEDIIEEADQELVLRKPHLEEARAALEAAQAMLDKARLDVQRCTIRAPFNAIIEEKFADLGARVSPSDPLVSVIGVDEYWVEVKVPVDQLPWIEFPQTGEETGSKVRIYNADAWGRANYRLGRVIRLLGQLEEQGRMARVLVEVKDPLGGSGSDATPPLLIGSYVRAEIRGRQIPEVFPIQREYFRNGREVWIMNDSNELDIRPAEIVFRSKDTVYIRDGLQDGDNIVTTDLSAPVQGMPLRTAGQGQRTFSESDHQRDPE